MWWLVAADERGRIHLEALGELPERGHAGLDLIALDPPTDGSSSGCIEVGRDLAKDILKNPADYYVNVHNAEYPAGALRGQLSK